MDALQTGLSRDCEDIGSHAEQRGTIRAGGVPLKRCFRAALRPPESPGGARCGSGRSGSAVLQMGQEFLVSFSSRFLVTLSFSGEGQPKMTFGRFGVRIEAF
jgi:hypothetical protein